MTIFDSGFGDPLPDGGGLTSGGNIGGAPGRRILVKDGRVQTKDGRAVLLGLDGTAQCCGCGGEPPPPTECPCPDGSNPTRPCCCDLPITDPNWCGGDPACACNGGTDSCECLDTSIGIRRCRRLDLNSPVVLRYSTTVTIVDFQEICSQGFDRICGPWSLTNNTTTESNEVSSTFINCAIGMGASVSFQATNDQCTQGGSFTGSRGVSIVADLDKQEIVVSTALQTQRFPCTCSGGDASGTITVGGGSSGGTTCITTLAFSTRFSYENVGQCGSQSLRDDFDAAQVAVQRITEQSDTGCASCGGRTIDLDDLDGFQVEE